MNVILMELFNNVMIANKVSILQQIKILFIVPNLIHTLQTYF